MTTIKKRLKIWEEVTTKTDFSLSNNIVDDRYYFLPTSPQSSYEEIILREYLLYEWKYHEYIEDESFFDQDYFCLNMLSINKNVDKTIRESLSALLKNIYYTGIIDLDRTEVWNYYKTRRTNDEDDALNSICIDFAELKNAQTEIFIKINDYWLEGTIEEILDCLNKDTLKELLWNSLSDSKIDFQDCGGGFLQAVFDINDIDILQLLVNSDQVKLLNILQNS